MEIDDFKGLSMKTKKKRHKFIITPDGREAIKVPAGIHYDELFAEEPVRRDINDLAGECLSHCKVVVIGQHEEKIVGCAMMHPEKVTAAVIRAAGRRAVQARWKNVTLATENELSADCREALKFFDFCLIKVQVLITKRKGEK
jgi:hypothetical protein